MPDYEPVYIISDSPAKKSVVFGFDAYAKTVADLIANKNNKTPLVIGIYGPWGSGKTTLMETVKGFLEDNDYTDKKTYRKCRTVWFQAWKYDKEDEILAALIEEIFKTMKRDGFLEACKAEIEALIEKTKPFKALGNLAKSITGIDLPEVFSELEYKSKLGFYITFQEFFDRLLWAYTNLRPKWTSSEEPDDSKGALVVFIDDLDRCPRSRILKVLETIKLFMDKKGCIFVIGAANEIIENALKDKDAYSDEDAKRFMDKIVQVTFNLPRIPLEEFEYYIKDIDPASVEKIKPHLWNIVTTTQNNPRRFKRFLNDLSLMEGLHKNKQTGVDATSLLFWKIIEFESPKLVEEAKENSEIFNILIEIIGDISVKDPNTGSWEIPADKIQAITQKSLQPYLEDRRLVEFIRNIKIPAEQVRQLISLSSIVKSTETALEEDKRIRQKLERRIDYKLGEMVEIPAGDFLYGDEKETVNIAEAFEIDIYPVTNSQFEHFIKEGGYEKEEYWDKEGWAWRQEEKITQPMYWNDEKWNQSEHPVVGVTYYEAKAYARWAGKVLPTEQQWEHAARGADGREYPWGDKFDETRCNSDESGIGRTSKVTRYPNGISPAGCYDMAGNVSGWTNSIYDESEGRVVLRGGSWNNQSDRCRCAFRSWDGPGDRSSDVGFRCARTLTL